MNSFILHAFVVLVICLVSQLVVCTSVEVISITPDSIFLPTAFNVNDIDMSFKVIDSLLSIVLSPIEFEGNSVIYAIMSNNDDPHDINKYFSYISDTPGYHSKTVECSEYSNLYNIFMNYGIDMVCIQSQRISQDSLSLDQEKQNVTLVFKSHEGKTIERQDEVLVNHYTQANYSFNIVICLNEGENCQVKTLNFSIKDMFSAMIQNNVDIGPELIDTPIHVNYTVNLNGLVLMKELLQNFTISLRGSTLNVPILGFTTCPDLTVVIPDDGVDTMQQVYHCTVSLDPFLLNKTNDNYPMSNGYPTFKNYFDFAIGNKALRINEVPHTLSWVTVSVPEAKLVVKTVESSFHSESMKEHTFYSLTAEFKYTGHYQLAFPIDSEVMVQLTHSDFCSIAHNMTSNTVDIILHSHNTTLGIFNRDIRACDFTLGLTYGLLDSIQSTLGSLKLAETGVESVDLLTHEFFSTGPSDITQIQIFPEPRTSRIGMVLPLILMDETLKLKLNLVSVANKDTGNINTTSIDIGLPSVQVVCPHEFDIITSSVTANGNDFIFSLSNQPYLTNNLVDNRQIYCEVVLPLQLVRSSTLSYSVIYNNNTIVTKSYEVGNQESLNYILLDSNTKPSYKVPHEGSGEMGTGFTDVSLHFQFIGTEPAKHLLSVVIANSFKAYGISSCTWNFKSDSEIHSITQFGKLDNTHFYINLSERVAFTSGEIDLNCKFLNSAKYTTLAPSTVSLMYSDFIPVLQTLANQQYQQLSVSNVASYSLNVSGEKSNFSVPPNKHNIIETIVISLTWKDKEGTVNQQFNRLRNICLTAAVSVNSKFTSDMLFPIDLTVNGSNMVNSGAKRISNWTFDELDVMIADNQKSTNQYMASFAFTVGSFKPSDIQNAINNELEKNNSLNDVTTSVIIDKIVEQCLDQGYGCGELCAPCTGDHSCHSDNDCISGICSYLRCHPYDLYVDNSVFIYNGKFSLLFVVSTIIYFLL